MDLSQPEQPAERYCGICKSFFANEAFDWLCSSCWKYRFRRRRNKKNGEDKQILSSTEPESLKQETLLVEPTKNISTELPKQADKSRCNQCNKKVGLLGIDCRCGLTLCNLHRMPEDHSCTVDYRKLGKEKLSKQHKKVVASKLQHI